MIESMALRVKYSLIYVSMLFNVAETLGKLHAHVLKRL